MLRRTGAGIETKKIRHPIKAARIEFAGAPYRTKLGTTGRRLSLYPNSISESHHGSPSWTHFELSSPRLHPMWKIGLSRWVKKQISNQETHHR